MMRHVVSNIRGGRLIASPGDTNEDSCMVYADAAGHHFRRSLNGKPINVAMCGVRRIGVQIADGH
jgi:hypothetical protein